MNYPTLSSPITLSYVAALRNFVPRQPRETFTYADASCRDTDLLICLAASNLEGKFIGIVSDAAACMKAQAEARMRGVSNVEFMQGTAAQVMASDRLPALNYLSFHATTDLAQCASLFELAEKFLLPTGLLNVTYAPYADAHGALKFLVREFAPEMSIEQAQEFLLELKKLGKAYFAQNPLMAAKLDQAIASKVPDEFFAMWDDGQASSKTFDMITTLRPRGFTYAGDAHIASNYIELSIPADAQEIIVNCRTNPLYEPLKDFALNRSMRSDIWCRQPAMQTGDMSELFGGFAYGITMGRTQVPSEFKALSKVIELNSPLYTKLIDLMTLMPISIGDFLSHPDGKDFLPLDIIGALQILIACDIAQPMRGGQHIGKLTSLDTPHLSGSFNQYLEKTELTGNVFRLASPVTGNAVAISPREALVMQAVDRAGLANSVSALLPELMRLAKNPAQAAQLMDLKEPTPEMAEHMIKDVLERSIVQWYAFGLLEAA